MFLHVTKAEYVEGYQIHCLFDDGREGVADLSHALSGPMFESLQDQKIFADFTLDHELGTVVWPNGADKAPEFLYYCAFKDDPSLQEQFRSWGYIH